MTDIYVGAGEPFTTIQAAVAAAVTGDVIHVADGNYALVTTLTIDKSISIVGESEGGVHVTGFGGAGYAILVTADGVSLSGFTLHGPGTSVGGNYGIKVQPDSGAIGDRLADFSLSDVTVTGFGRTEIDLNGVDGATLSNVTADGLGTSGAGIALTDSANVTLTDIATTGNTWGGVAIYTANRFYDQASANISFSGSFSATETIKIWSEDASNGIAGDGNTEVGGVSSNLSGLTLPSSFAGNHGWQVLQAPGAAVSTTWYFATEGEADAFLAVLTAPQRAAALMQNPAGEWVVKPGMSVQAAVNAADPGDTISIYAGTYVESGNPQSQPGNYGGLYINKAGLTLQGVDAMGQPLTDAATVQASGPTIVSGTEGNFGNNHWLDEDADGVTLTGIHWKAGNDTTNKVLEIWGDNATIRDNFIDRIAPDGHDTFAVAIYLNGDGEPGEQWISAYTIADNIMNEGVVVASGVGDYTAGVGANQLITGNSFIDGYDYDTGLGRYDGIVINGQTPTVGWLPESTQIPTISGNSFDAGTPFVLRGSEGDPDKLPNLAEVQAILAGNTVERFAYVVDPMTGDLRYAVTTTGSGDIHRFVVANTIDTLNLALDTGYDNVFFGAQRDYMHAGDTVVIQSGAASLDSAVMVEGLTIAAQAGSADLDLTLATELANGTPISGGGVHAVTLADHAPGLGAAVDVTGNALDNTITGNSGANALAGGGGADRLTGGAGTDALDGGTGIDTAVYSDAVSVAAAGGAWVVTSAADGTETLANIEIVEDAAGGDTLLVGNGGFATIQAAINAASAGDTILVAAGLWDEDLLINKAVTILGAHAGEAGTAGTRDAAGGMGETTIIGRASVTTPGGVTLDGLRFLNDATTTNGGAGGPLLRFTAASAGGDHVVENTVFWSVVAGGANGVDDRAVSVEVMGSGSVSVADSLISGTSTGGFSTAAWGRGLWFDGGGVNLSVTGTSFQSTRTGMNLDVSGTSDIAVSGNSFTNAGTAISTGILAGGVLDGIVDNDFANVGTEFNLRNLTTDLVFDAEVAVRVLTPVGPDSFVGVYGGSGADHIMGTSGSDALDGNNLTQSAGDADTLDGRDGADVLFGRGGDDRLIGGAGNDTVDGGAGSDTLVLTGNRAEYGFSGSLPGAITVTDLRGGSPDGTDTVTNVEFVQFADRTMTLAAVAANAAPSDIAFTGSLAEDAPLGTVVGTASAVDGEIAGGDSITFSLTDDAGGRFAIDATTGVVTLVGAVDAEAALSHDITILATDSGGLSRSETFTIAVGDVDEFDVTAPMDTDPTANAVAENAAAGTTVGIAVAAADGDATNSGVTFSLVNDAGGRFAIDMVMGLVTTTQALDYEAGASWGITVRATSADGSFADTAYTVAVGNLAEAPVITSSGGGAAAAISVTEGTSFVVDVNATDSDGTVPTYALSGADAAQFTINATTGVISFVHAPDFEAPSDADHDNTYDILVTATDGMLVDTQALSVSVLNQAETVSLVLTTGPDGYTATSDDNFVIDGLAGNDTITTGGGSDVVFGNAGNDVIDTGAGNDVVTYSGTNGGADVVNGGAGSDDRINALTNGTVIGLSSLSGIEMISANGKTGVKIKASANGDALDLSGVTLVNITQVELDKGNDTLEGSGIADTILGGKGDDVLDGGAGNDTFLIAAGDGIDAIAGGSGIDVIKATANNVAIGLSSLSGIETITADGRTGVSILGSSAEDLLDFSAVTLVGIGTLNAGSGDDTLTGTALADTILGGSGNDQLDGGDGDDDFLIAGSAGTDTLIGGSGSDRIVATAANVAIAFGSWSGIETITGNGFANVTIAGTSAGDVMDFSAYALSGIARIDGGNGDDAITGSAGADVLSGGAGVDTLAGGAGNDLLIFDSTADSFDGGANYDTLRAAGKNAVLTWDPARFVGIEAIDGAGFANVKILGTSAGEAIDLGGIALTGISLIDAGSGADTVIGSGNADTINGGNGNDDLSGGGGDDLFLFNGSSGRDTIAGDGGTDTIRAMQSNVALTWGVFSGIERIEGGGFTGVRILGGTSGDAIDLSGIVVTGITAVDGGGGNDAITGSAGADTLIGGAGADTLTGGGGADVFDFNLAAESKGTAIDLITDFVQGVDRIDLASIDANTQVGADQAFALVAAFTGAAGQLILDTATIVGVTRILADTNGDTAADMEIRLTGTYALTGTDFLL